MMINNDYRIESDELNVILSRRMVGKDREGNERITWKNIGFFPTIKDTLQYLAKREILGTGLKDVETINKKIQDLYSYIENLVSSEK